MPGNIEYTKNLRKTLQVTERKHAYLGFYHPIFFQKQYNENIKKNIKKKKTSQNHALRIKDRRYTPQNKFKKKYQSTECDFSCSMIKECSRLKKLKKPNN